MAVPSSLVCVWLTASRGGDADRQPPLGQGAHPPDGDQLSRGVHPELRAASAAAQGGQHLIGWSRQHTKTSCSLKGDDTFSVR